MPIAQLFENLSNHYSLPHDFSEDISHLQGLSFSETGIKLKKILEETYTDGIDGFEEVESDGEEITGIFIDKVSPKVTKRYRFTITINGISYQLENPDDVAFTELEFAATKMFGGSKKPKNCTKGTACGNGCINKNKKCSKPPSPAQKKLIAQVVGGDGAKKKPSTKTNKKPTKATPKDPRIHSITNQKDFEDAALYAYTKLADKYNDFVPIHEIRRTLGETVPRDKFEEYMLDMQANDLLLFKGGSLASGGREEIEDSLQIPSAGLRTYATLEISKEDLDKRISSKKKTLNKLLDNPPPLDRLGTARELQEGAKISSDVDFNKVVDEAYKRLDSQFKYGDLVPIEKVREALGDRLSPDDFDKYTAKLVEDDKYQPIEANNPTESQQKGAYKTQFGAKHYFKKL